MAALVALHDGPRSLQQIVENYHSYARFIGAFAVEQRLQNDPKARQLEARIDATLRDLVNRGSITRQGDLYALTDEGRSRARDGLGELRRAGQWLRDMAQPESVSKVSLIAHLVLAGLKVPAAYLSGSAGLLSDAADTLLDGISCLLVYTGLRLNRERLANALLVGIMMVTGAATLCQAIHRLFVPQLPQVTIAAAAAETVAGVMCHALWAYQRMIGLRSGSLSLITQSVDSRNHVIVAAGVTCGLVVSSLGFQLLDTVVGLAVALLIAKSAVELLLEVRRSMNEEELDLDRYKPGLLSRYEGLRRAQLRDWLLYLVERRGVDTEDALGAERGDAVLAGQDVSERDLSSIAIVRHKNHSGRTRLWTRQTK